MLGDGEIVYQPVSCTLVYRAARFHAESVTASLHLPISSLTLCSGCTVPLCCTCFSQLPRTPVLLALPSPTAWEFPPSLILQPPLTAPLQNKLQQSWGRKMGTVRVWCERRDQTQEGGEECRSSQGSHGWWIGSDDELQPLDCEMSNHIQLLRLVTERCLQHLGLIWTNLYFGCAWIGWGVSVCSRLGQAWGVCCAQTFWQKQESSVRNSHALKTKGPAQGCDCMCRFSSESRGW